MLPLDDEVSGVLQAVNVDDQTIALILNALSSGETLDPAMAKVSPASYGASSAGQLLGYHTDLAHQKVVDAMKDMIKGFTGLSDNVRTFKKHFDDVDSGTGQSMTTGTAKVTDIPTIQQSGDCTASPTVAGSSCTIQGNG